MAEYQIDAMDAKLLEVLQEDSRISNHDIAQRIGSSPSSVWRRIKSLEDVGIIQRHGVTIDTEKLGLSETLILQVSLNRHTEDYTAEFTRLVTRLPEVLECYATTGSYDYTLKVVAKDMRAYHKFLRDQLLSKPFIDKAYTLVTMEKVKEQGKIPASFLL